MIKHLTLIFLAILLLLTSYLPIQALAGRITPWKTELGDGCIANGSWSTAIGNHTTAQGDLSMAMGYQTTAYSAYETVMGIYSQTSGGSPVDWEPFDRLFVIGNGRASLRSNAMVILKIGNVGIGTNHPQNLLDLGTANGKKLAVFQTTAGNDFYGFGISSDTLEIYAGAAVSASPAMVVKKTTGNVGIGKVNPGYRLEVNGNAAKTSGGTTWINSSDERLKDITGEYDRGLDAIVSLKPVIFYYKEGNPRGLPTAEENIGFIAQEVQDVFPEAVSEGKDGYLDFNMHPVNVAVVNAIKELKAENEALKQEIRQIKAALGL